MATIALTAAGAAIGAAALPAGVTVLGATLTGAAIGSALGSAVGGVIDQRLLSPAGRTQGPRLKELYVQSSAEGAPIPRAYGRIRLSAHVIWSPGYTEAAVTRSAGGKGGGGSATTYSYSVSVALGLCEGEIAGVGRIWADGKPMPLEGVTWRLHTGAEDQAPDPLIALHEGEADAPAYRGLAYIVFEDLPLDRYGARLPQISVEVMRAPAKVDEVAGLRELAQGVALSPGCGEFALSTRPVRRRKGEGSWAVENVNNAFGRPDILVALDQLEDGLPGCKSALLVVTWFGDDLRAGRCRTRPCVESSDKETAPLVWSVAGLSREQARLTSRDAGGRPNFGGTPSDDSLREAIAELKRRGFHITLYPFVLMDIPAGNGLPDPWGGDEQAAFPWRGRIASAAADRTDAAGDEARAFFGAADGWGLRRMVRHYAQLCAEAGGVDAFCIGSEMRGLTQIRDADGGYPAVAEFRALAAEARAILGAQTAIGYAADWSEYFGHQPNDGSGDVFFHLDPLWADTNIDFVGVDNYLPLSDWRDEDGHADAAWPGAHDRGYLAANVEGGEGYAWFYASDGDRAAQIRTPITDGAYGEDWVFRPKDFRNWWLNAHHDRPGGLRAANPTDWVPGMKPIRFMELGFPAVDKGANQPNVFIDPKSAESAAPYFSSGARDDAMQRRAIEALLGYWQAENAVSPHDGRAMIDLAHSHIWTWDTRPFPDYPLRVGIWADGANYDRGHWINGRAEAAPLADVVADICAQSGEAADVSALVGMVEGYVIDRSMSARDALAPLAEAFAFDARESGGRVAFRHRAARSDGAVEAGGFVVEDKQDGAAPYALTRAQETDLPQVVRFGYVRSDGEYQPGAVETRDAVGASRRVSGVEAAVAMSEGAARAAAERRLREAWAARETLRFSLPPSMMRYEPGDVLRFGAGAFRIESAAFDLVAEIEAARVEAQAYRTEHAAPGGREPPQIRAATPVLAEFLDLPSLDGSGEVSTWVGACGDPWPGQAAVWRSATGADWRLTATLDAQATMGALAAPLAAAEAAIFDRGAGALVRVVRGAFQSRVRSAVLGGANLIALKTPAGEWEVAQFETATLLGTGLWRLSGLLRGRAGTEHLIAASLPEGTRVVLIDGALARVDLPAVERGIGMRWRVGPSRLPAVHEICVEQAFDPKGAALRPYAPVGLRAAQEAEGLRLRWLRRSRILDDGLEREPPLGEEAERYRVELYGADGLIRTEEVAAPEWLYDAAAQASEGALRVAIRQISATYGPGAGAGLTLGGLQ